MKEQFINFGKEHITSLFLYTILLVFSVYLSKKIKNRELFAKLLGVFFAIELTLELLVKYFFLSWPLGKTLPFHLCNIELYLVSLMLIRRSYFIFEIAYFWGIGAIIALITPELMYKFPHFVNISYFITHYYIIFGIIFAIKYFKFRPTIKSAFRSFFALNLVSLIVYPINIITDSNYMFLIRKPPIASPLDYLGPWPFYIFNSNILMGIIFIFMALPFSVNKSRKQELKCFLMKITL